MDSTLDHSAQTRRPYLRELLCVLIVVALCFKMAWRVDLVRDIHLGDESFFYLAPGCDLTKSGLPEASMAPLYCIWYYLLSLVQPDRVLLYDWSWAALSCWLALGFYGLGRTLSGSSLIGLVGTFLFVNMQLLDAHPYPAHLAAILILFGAMAAIRVRPATWSGAALASALLLAAFVRPEWFVAFLLSCLAEFGILALAWRRTGWHKGLLLPPLFIAALASATLAIFGNPLAGGRSFIAFGQHYALMASRNGPPPTQNPFDYWEPYVRADFGDAKTVGAAFGRNPDAMVEHVLTNLQLVPETVGRLLSPRFALCGIPRRMIFVLTALALAGGLLGWMRIAVAPTSSSAAPATTRSMALIMLACILPPIVLVVALIHPREHYFVVPLALAAAVVLSGWARWLTDGRWSRSLHSFPGLAALGLFFFLATANLAYRHHAWALVTQPPLRRPAATPARAIIAKLNEYDLPEPIRMAGHIGHNPAYYTGKAYTNVDLHRLRAKLGFQQQLRDLNVDVVVIQSELRRRPDLKAIPGFENFVAAEPNEDYWFVPIGSGDVTLAVRKNRISVKDSQLAGLP